VTDQLHRLGAAAGEAPGIPFEEANVLFIVNGGAPQHKGFKNSVHQLLLRRGISPVAPKVTRMVFFSEPFNQYVVQEITTEHDEISCEVADVFSGSRHSRLEQLQRGMDLIVIFTNRSSIASPSQRQLLGIERTRPESLQNIPHILIMVNESANKPSPEEAFAAAHGLASLPNVAVLYQAASSRQSLGPCHILHIDGCLQGLRPRGRFDGRSHLNCLVEWRDLPELELGTAMERLVLAHHPSHSAQIPTEGDGRGVDRAFAEELIGLEPDIPSQGAEDRTIRRVRRISQLLAMPTRDPSALSRLQQELRLEHRRNSRALPTNWERPLSLRPESIVEEPISPSPEQPPCSSSFRGECPICCEEDSQLVFLLKQSSQDVPEDGSMHWPFALGADPANDIVSAFLCCDNCSYYVVEDGRTPLRETCTGAFSLIPYTANAERWKDDLSKGLSHYDATARELLPPVFLAIVDMTLRTKSWAQSDGSEENEIRRNALMWAKGEIIHNVHMTGNGHSDFVGAWITKVVTDPQRGWASMVWQYPMPGFVLMLRLAREYLLTSHPSPPLPDAASLAPSEVLGKVLWQRLLVETVRRFRAPHSALTFTHVFKLNEILLAETSVIADDEWLSYVAAEGMLSDEAFETIQALPVELEWVQRNCRFAMVLWLGWMPEAQELEGSTAEVVEKLVDESAAEVIVEAPGDVGREWCGGVGMAI
jgi:hypothetical protein